jgi:hypothetical protein
MKRIQGEIDKMLLSVLSELVILLRNGCSVRKADGQALRARLSLMGSESNQFF